MGGRGGCGGRSFSFSFSSLCQNKECKARKGTAVEVHGGDCKMNPE